MKMNYIIRKATASDYEALCTLFEEIDALHRDNLPHRFQKPPGPARSADYVAGLILDEDVGLFVAQVEDQLVGFTCFRIRETSPVPILVRRRYAFVDDLVVSEPHRRKGIGRELADKGHEWALSKGADSVELNVWTFNEGAIAFYRQLGYETASQRMVRQLR
jgi:ribosomal protein S18 acetylase RimI-like enzyme